MPPLKGGSAAAARTIPLVLPSLHIGVCMLIARTASEWGVQRLSNSHIATQSARRGGAHSEAVLAINVSSSSCRPVLSEAQA